MESFAGKQLGGLQRGSWLSQWNELVVAGNRKLHPIPVVRGLPIDVDHFVGDVRDPVLDDAGLRIQLGLRVAIRLEPAIRDFDQ